MKTEGAGTMYMDYCKFENTAQDLMQCIEGWDADDEDGEVRQLSEYEASGRRRILEYAVEIVAMYTDDIEERAIMKAYDEEQER